MTLIAIISMFAILSFVIGGFVYFLIKAYKKEKNGQN